MTDVQDDFPAHEQTYQSFSKLVLFSILFIVLLLSCMALGLLGSSGFFALVLGIGGTVALLIAFAEGHAFKDPGQRRLFGDHLVMAGLPE